MRVEPCLQRVGTLLRATGFTYQGAGLYTLSLALSAGDYVFKVAETNWSNPNLGAPEKLPLG